MNSKEKIFNKSLIEEAGRQVNCEYAENALEYINYAITESINKIVVTKPVISGFDFFITNEFINLANCQSSNMEALFIIKSAQLELNSSNLNKNYISKFWKYFKQTLRDFASLKPKKKKKLTKGQQKAAVKTKKEKYSMMNFKIELLSNLIAYFNETSSIEITSEGLTFYTKEELGIDVVLKFVFADGDKYKLFDTSVYKFKTIDYAKRIDNLKKLNFCEPNFKVMLRIFNSLYYSVMDESLNQILIESIISSIPSKFYKDKNIYNGFLNVLNYICLNKQYSKYYAITNKSKTVLDEKLIKSEDLTKFIKFINIVSKSV